LEILKEYGMVNDEDNTEIDPAVRQSTVALEYFPANPIPRDLGTTTAAAVPTTTGKALTTEAFVSRDWTAQYKNSHVDVSYSSCFGESNSRGVDRQTNSQNQVNSPPKPPTPSNVPENNGDDHWNAMFKRALAPLVDAVSVAQREHQGGVAATTSSFGDVVMSNGQSSKKRPGRRKPRKIIPEVKAYYEFNEKVSLLTVTIVSLVHQNFHSLDTF
jgi:hypothetical protein